MGQGALITGASGLRAFQQQLDVVANNLANLNTIGFKSSSVTFSDLVYKSLRSAAGSTDDNFGGINPAQIGSGVRISQISRNFLQGELQETGEALDFGIRGDGFFVFQDALGENLFSRSGAFSLDNNGNLVDPATGYLVQRTGTVGDAADGQFGFQAVGDTRINIPFGSAIPGRRTTEIEFSGNLPSDASPPLREVISTTAPFLTAAGPADLTTQFSDLTTNQTIYGAGDLIEVAGTDVTGLTFNFTIDADTATVGDLVDELNNRIVGASVALEADGNLSITAIETGEAFLSLTIGDAATNVGFTAFNEHIMVVEVDGTSGDTFESASQLFDAQGNAQNTIFTFRKIGINTWEVTNALSGGEGTLVDPPTYTVSFDEDGTFAGVISSNDSLDLQVQFNPVSSVNNVTLSFLRLTQTATNFGMTQVQDGSSPGVLADVSVSGDGLITGIGSNGISFPVAQLAIANFSNVDGLETAGANYLSASSASGATQIGKGQSNGRGTVIGSQLETSNVDITREFAQLIVAQRAFAANARTMTVAEQVLEEITNIIR